MNYFVTGIDTDSGTTLASAILCEALAYDYWKPVQAGTPKDSDTVKSLSPKTFIHRERYFLNTPASPHAAAKIANVTIQLTDFIVPKQSGVIIEDAGGCLVPLNDTDFVIDLTHSLNAEIILVAVAALLVALSLIAGSSIATWQAIVARRERVRAEKRFNDVRKIASAVIFEYHDKIVNLPDSTELDEKMLSDTVIYLDQLSQEGTDDIELQLELARAYKKVGDIQGGSANANRTKFDSAAESYLKALRLTESAAEKRPDDIAILNQLGRIYRDLAGIERIKGKLDDSVLHFQQAAKIYRQMLVIVPDDVKAVQGLAWSQINIATQREEPHQVEESLLICREAVALLERLAESNPENSDYKSHLPGAYDALADVMMAIPDRRTEALGVYRKTLPLLEQFLVQTPNDINLIDRIATTHAYIADAHHLTGEPDLALASYRESVSRFDRLVEMDKKNDYALFLRSYVKTLFGRFLAERKDATQAIAVLRDPLAALPTVLLLGLASQRIVLRLRKQLFGAIAVRSVPFFDQHTSGELVNRLSADAEIMSKGLIENFAQGIRHVVEGIGGVAVILWLSPKLTLPMLSVVPPVFLGAFFYGKKVAELSAQVTDKLAQATSFAEERLSAIRTVRMFAQEPREIAQYGQKAEAVFAVARQAAILNASFVSSVFFGVNMALLLLLYSGAPAGGVLRHLQHHLHHHAREDA